MLCLKQSCMRRKESKQPVSITPIKCRYNVIKEPVTNNVNNTPCSNGQKIPVKKRKKKRVTFRYSEHEYEPIGAPKTQTAPVVRITDTDVVPVADSDDSIDDRTRIPLELTRAGDVVLPLDGKIEDSAMEGRELVETGDTSEELESPQEFQERIEERFLSAATPATESRTDGELNTSQVDSLALEELPLRRGARGFPQRLKSQAGKLRTRLRNIQRPTFAFADRQKPEKPKSTSSGRSDRSRSEKRPSRMDRIRSSFSERPKFNLPSRPKFSLPDRSKFHLPERPKFNLPDRPKFNIKKPNIRLPNALTRAKKPPSGQRSTDSSAGSRRNIFDFSTYPRIFEKKSKARNDFATSTPKDSRAESVENATFPRTRKAASERWAQRFDDTAYIDDDRPEAVTVMERSRPWRHPSFEEPRLSIRTEDEVLTALPWEARQTQRQRQRQDDIQFMDYELESPEDSEHQPPPEAHGRTDIDPRLYGDQDAGYQGANDEIIDDEFERIPRSRSLNEEVLHDERYEGSFPAMDPPRRFGRHKLPSEDEPEEEEFELEDEEEEEYEERSAPSDKEQQQSSGSSCDRRRRGVIEEIDSDEFFLREGGLSQGDTILGSYLTNEIRDALRAQVINALADDSMMVAPMRPERTRSFRKRKEGSVDSYEVITPVRPKRGDRARRSESADNYRERTRSDSRHRVVYQAEGSPREMSPVEPLDDIVVVKPIRRKSKSSQRSQSVQSLDPPPVVPTRRKRARNQNKNQRATPDEEENHTPICNGHAGDWTDNLRSQKYVTLTEQSQDKAFTDREMAPPASQVVARLRDEEPIRGEVPIPPKRRSRSRGTSVAQDEDRTSHGAESLPEVGYAEDDIPRDELEFGLSAGYAIIDKREKPPRPPPPRRRRDKFATTPRPVVPKRPQRAYSTLASPARSRAAARSPDEVRHPDRRYIEFDSDDGDLNRDLRSGEILNKMQGRPLPAPPRPPRLRRGEGTVESFDQEYTTESTIATQTDPLPDDMIIEEEITQAKLVVAPSTSGSQILVSTERIPSPLSTVPPPLRGGISQRLRRTEEDPYDTVSLKSPSPIREHDNLEDRHLSAPHLDEPIPLRDYQAEIRAALASDEPLRIANLEVADLRVDRLSVSQLEASKIVTSEVDALVITASELKNLSESLQETGLSPSIVRELIAIRSHLERVAASSSQIEEETRRPAEPEASERTVPDISGDDQETTRTTEEKPDQQKVVKREVEKDKQDLPATRTLSVLEVDVKDKVTHTLSVCKVEKFDKATHSPSGDGVDSTTDEKSLQILDTGSPFSLSPNGDQSLRAERTELAAMAEDSTDNLESTSDNETKLSRRSRSRSSSPSQGIGVCRVRQTASPVRSLPPAISVTPDTPDAATTGHGVINEIQPQRAIISYSSSTSSETSSQRPPNSSFPLSGTTHFIAFPASQFPAELLSLTQGGPSIIDLHQIQTQTQSLSDATRQFLRALRLAGIKAIRHCVGYLASRTGEQDSREKIREIELMLCALLLLIAGLLIFFFSSTRTVTHHHHWDYFNPPQ